MSNSPILTSRRGGHSRIPEFGNARAEALKSAQEQSFGSVRENLSFFRVTVRRCGDNMGKREQKPVPSISEASQPDGKQREIRMGKGLRRFSFRYFNGETACPGRERAPRQWFVLLVLPESPWGLPLALDRASSV
jgi:hypothetical protein